MGGITYFDRMLPVPRHEHPQKLDSGERQLEVFSHGQGIHVRLGPIGVENGGTDRYTATLTMAEARELLEGLAAVVRYFGG